MKAQVISTATVEVVLPFLTVEQYFNALDRSKAYQLVEEYNVHKEYKEEAPNQTDSIYERTAVKIENLKSINKLFTKQLLEQLDREGVKFEALAPKLQESVELAVLKAYDAFANVKNNFGVVKLGKGRYVLASMDKDDITIRLLSPVQGAIIVYRPKVFVPFVVESKSK